MDQWSELQGLCRNDPVALPYMRHLIFRPVWICLRGQKEVPCWLSFCCQPHWIQTLEGFSTIQTNVGIFFKHYGTGVNFSAGGSAVLTSLHVRFPSVLYLFMLPRSPLTSSGTLSRFPSRAALLNGISRKPSTTPCDYPFKTAISLRQPRAIRNSWATPAWVTLTYHAHNPSKSLVYPPTLGLSCHPLFYRLELETPGHLGHLMVASLSLSKPSMALLSRDVIFFSLTIPCARTQAA